MARQEELFETTAGILELAPGAMVFRGFATPCGRDLLDTITRIAKVSSFRHMTTPGGWRMSAALTNCGPVGWVTDRSGYRYDSVDPETARPWPAMPALFSDLARRAASQAGFANFEPDACLMNRYEPGARLSLHQDKNEEDFSQPIVSISLGLPATFLFGGSNRSDRPRRIHLRHGDVAVWGGLARMAYHGIDPLDEGEHPATGAFRYNLTLRRAR
jgi:alkylated DNA repair protein (DNA oxidative demethylase)